MMSENPCESGTSALLINQKKRDKVRWFLQVVSLYVPPSPSLPPNSWGVTVLGGCGGGDGLVRLLQGWKECDHLATIKDGINVSNTRDLPF